MNYQFIDVNIEDKVGYLLLSRPEKYNALCIAMVKEINHCFHELKNNESLNALFILGNEKAFCAGGDLKEMQFLSKEEAETRSQYVQDTFQILQTLSFPVVAWVNGICFGGGLELVLHCDFCFCSENAQLALPEVKYGMIPGAGGVTLLKHRMSKADAMYYLSTGDVIPLEKAYQSGLVQALYTKEAFDKNYIEKQKYFSTTNSEALRAIKKINSVDNKIPIKDVYSMESDSFSSLLYQNGRKGIDKNFKK